MTINDLELDRRLNALPRQTDAPEALWPAINQRITRRRRRIWLSGIAAALVIAVLIEPIANHFRTLAPPDLNSTFNLAATVFAAEVDAMRHSAPDKQQLAQTGLPVSLDQDWEEAWRLNQSAIDELEQALELSPDNRLLMEFLARARLRQSEIINQTTAAMALADHRSS